MYSIPWPPGSVLKNVRVTKSERYQEKTDPTTLVTRYRVTHASFDVWLKIDTDLRDVRFFKFYSLNDTIAPLDDIVLVHIWDLIKFNSPKELPFYLFEMLSVEKYCRNIREGIKYEFVIADDMTMQKIKQELPDQKAIELIS